MYFFKNRENGMYYFGFKEALHICLEMVARLLIGKFCSKVTDNAQTKAYPWKHKTNIIISISTSF